MQSQIRDNGTTADQGNVLGPLMFLLYINDIDIDINFVHLSASLLMIVHCIELLKHLKTISKCSVM